MKKFISESLEVALTYVATFAVSGLGAVALVHFAHSVAANIAKRELSYKPVAEVSYLNPAETGQITFDGRPVTFDGQQRQETYAEYFRNAAFLSEENSCYVPSGLLDVQNPIFDLRN